MARPLRIEFPGAFHHVMSRGNQKQLIYKNRRDRSKFLEYLESASVRYGANIHCYCLMDNHYHLLLETPDSNLAQIMRHINGAYTTYFNTKHRRVGHLFQGRYRSVLVDADTYCLALSRYIHLNPVKEGLSASPATYEWSSYRCYMDEQEAREWLQTNFLLSIMGQGSEVRQRYQKYVEADDDSFNDLYAAKSASMAVLGRQEFVQEIREKHLANRHVSRDLPAARALRTRPEIQQIVDVVAGELRDDHRLVKKMSIYLCHHFSGFSLKEIGAHFGVGESAVSENSNRFAMTLYKDQRLAEMVAGVLA
ncbi:MAG: transposase, partial [Desulfuromonadales bacterium]|nr:transposase [Desulfuromonadales bacterium]